MSADTIIPDLYNPQSLNRYSYVLNNPIVYNDPSGHWVIPAIAIVAAIVIVVVFVDFIANGWQNQGDTPINDPDQNNQLIINIYSSPTPIPTLPFVPRLPTLSSPTPCSAPLACAPTPTNTPTPTTQPYGPPAQNTPSSTPTKTPTHTPTKTPSNKPTHIIPLPRRYGGEYTD